MLFLDSPTKGWKEVPPERDEHPDYQSFTLLESFEADFFAAADRVFLVLPFYLAFRDYLHCFYDLAIDRNGDLFFLSC